MVTKNKSAYGKLSEVPCNEIYHCFILCVRNSYLCLLCLETPTHSILPPFPSPFLIFQKPFLILEVSLRSI